MCVIPLDGTVGYHPGVGEGSLLDKMGVEECCMTYETLTLTIDTSVKIISCSLARLNKTLGKHDTEAYPGKNQVGC